MLPSPLDLQDNSNVYHSICKAGQLRSIDDRRWWESDAVGEVEGSALATHAAAAADLMLRMPTVSEPYIMLFTILTQIQIVLESCSRRVGGNQCSVPEPVGHASALLQGLTQLQEDLEGIQDETSRDIRRRRGFMLSEFAALHGLDCLTARERSDLVAYENAFL